MKWQFGLSIDKKNLEEFKKNFERIAGKHNINKMVQILKIDAEITKVDFSKETIEDLKKMEPFGEKNRNPIFVYKNLKINSIRALSEGKHLKLLLKDENSMINAIGFNLGCLSEEYFIGDKVDIAGTLEVNSFGGQESVQINIKDIMKSI